MSGRKWLDPRSPRFWNTRGTIQLNAIQLNLQGVMLITRYNTCFTIKYAKSLGVQSYRAALSCLLVIKLLCYGSYLHYLAYPDSQLAY